MPSCPAPHRYLCSVRGGVKSLPSFAHARFAESIATFGFAPERTCGVRVEDIAEPTMQEIRYLDKLVEELARGKAMENILRTP